MITTRVKLAVVGVVICVALLIAWGVSNKIQNDNYARQTDALTTKATALEAESLKKQGEAESLGRQVTSLQDQLKTETERRAEAESELTKAHTVTAGKRTIYEKTRNTPPRVIGDSDADLRAAAEALGIRP